jgi:hypothetical protein
MLLNLEELIPKENPWFSPNVEYSGEGRADFADNRGSAEGNVIARFDEFGNASITMDVSHMASVKGPIDDLWELAASQIIVDELGRKNLMLGLPMRNHPCARLAVCSSAGTFSCLNPSYQISEANQISFFPSYTFHSHFNSLEARPPKYWIAPLLNFTSEFCRGDALYRHPLRIFPTPAIPDGLSKDEYLRAYLVANSRNQIIHFDYNGSPAFIEPLADYSEREAKLKNGTECRSITAIMVGVVGNDSSKPESVKVWFPYGIERVLGFATGTEVGIPWIEFRDEFGALASRIHEGHGTTRFVDGHRVIREGIHRGTGQLLTRYLSSEHSGKSLDVAMSHAMQGWSFGGLTLEEMFIYVARGLDCLCNYFGLATQDLDKRLKPGNRELVKGILQKMAQELRSLAKPPNTPGDEQENAALLKIAERASSTPWGKTRDFGLSVGDLLRKFGLNDATVRDAHFRTKTSGARTWSSDLSRFRGAPIHEGCFDIDGGRFDIDNVITVTRHLHDALVRVILKMLKYEGRYQPTVTPGTTTESADWVRADTPARRLGFD